MKLRRMTATAASVVMTSAFMMLASGAQPAAAIPAPTRIWEQNIPGQFVESSPNVGVINGEQAVVIGHSNGNLYSLKTSDGTNVPGWPRHLGMAINSSPAIADVDGNGDNEVFVGSGTSADFEGRNWGLNTDGTVRWNYRTVDSVDASHAIHSSPAIGDVNGDGFPDVSGFTLGHRAWSFTATSGVINGGWPFIQDDSTFSSPALADLDGDGVPEYVVGGDSTEGAVVDNRGGVVRAVRGDGSLMWQFLPNEAIRSSPVVGDVTGDGQPEIIVGAGDFWDKHGGASDSTKIFVLNRFGTLLWTRDLGAHTLAAPALADVDGNGTYDIIEGTWDGNAAAQGRITVFNGDGSIQPNWNRKASGAGNILGQVSTADFDNDGGQDILMSAALGTIAYSGKTGAQLFTLNLGIVSYQNTPWIGDVDGDNRLDIVVAGMKQGTQGIITRYEMPDTTAKLGARGWSQYRKDARHTGSLIPTPLSFNRCAANPGEGYYMVARDGGIFTFCVPYHGSTGGMRLNQPIVGMATAPNNAGYWEVASDGGIFTQGPIGYYGSTGHLRLNQPIVGMAATKSGNGYWLVARDGGIFAFGDAGFYGSTGNIRLNQPIVGMAATKSGDGYWLVAADGGVFAFGDAVFKGSTGDIRLNQPIVGMATTASGNGYWLVAADGGIFTFGDAAYYGSTGNIRLNQPIVSIVRSNRGNGYRMIARDGGIFNYGDAGYVGSAGSLRLNQPIVGGA